MIFCPNPNTTLFCLYFILSIIAEGVPESQTRAFNKVAIDKGVGIIGPATVGGIKVHIICNFLEVGEEVNDFTKPLSSYVCTRYFVCIMLAWLLSDWEHWRNA